MRRLTTTELLFLQDLCIDAEFRCHERATRAEIRGDSSTAARELECREQYRQLKQAILDDLLERGNHAAREAPPPPPRRTRKEHATAADDFDVGSRLFELSRLA